MKILSKFLQQLLVILTLFLGINFGISFAVNCTDGREYSQNLPPTIGKEDQVQKFPFALYCDTIFVRRGVTTTIFPGTMIYFAKPSPDNVIKVEGTLNIKGSKNSYVSLSGSIDSTKNGIEAGNKQWGGIEVAAGGTLNLEYVGFMRAPTPITAFSQNVKISNSWFKGSSGMILADGTPVNMDSKWYAINNMDLTKGAVDIQEPVRDNSALSDKEKAEILNPSKQKFWTWKKTSTTLVTVALLGAGTAFFLLPDNSNTTTKLPKIEPDKSTNTTSKGAGLSPFNLPFPTP